MRTSKRFNVSHATLSDLSARFEQYEREMPEDSFPTFLETLLFDQQDRTSGASGDARHGPEPEGRQTTGTYRH